MREEETEDMKVFYRVENSFLEWSSESGRTVIK